MVAESVLVELPGDKLYPEECRIQTFTYSDAIAISLLRKTQDVRKLFEVLDRRMNLNVQDLTLQDFWFILYWHRINSYSSFPIKLPWTCHHCKTKNYDELRGSDLIIEDLDPEYHHGITLNFNSVGPVKLRLKLVKDEIESERYLRDQGLKDQDFALEETLDACMLEPNGGNLSERISLLQEMNSDDHFLLKAFESEFNYGVQKYSKFTCENESCKEVVKVHYEFDLTNFFPSFQDKSDVRSRILSSKTSGTTNRKSSGNGSNEDDLYKRDSYQESETTQRETRSDEVPNKSPKVSQEVLEITPEELNRLIRDGVKQATGQSEDPLVPLEDLVKDR